MAEKLCGIYKIENKVNNKIYIGQSIDIKRRFKNHKNALLKNKHKNRHLQFAWNKYGEGNFIFEIIEFCIEKYLDCREIYWIKYYNSTNDECGYNLVSGGNKNKIYNEEVKRKMKENHPDVSGTNNSFYGKHHTDETKQLLSQLHRGNNSIFYGKHFTDEHKQKISESNQGNNNWLNKTEEEKVEWKKKISEGHKGISATHFYKKIICLTTNEIFESLKFATDKYHSHHICDCCKGKANYAGHLPDGTPLHWQYLSDYILEHPDFNPNDYEQTNINPETA